MTRRGKFFVMRLSDGAILRRREIYDAEPAFKDWWFYGYNAWDRHGRFYFASFKSLSKSTGTRLVAIDPARFLAATTPASGR